MIFDWVDTLKSNWGLLMKGQYGQIMIFIFFLGFLIVSIGTTSWAETADNEILLSLDLPKPVAEVYFQEETTVGVVTQNGESKPYQMVGTAFVFDNTTYVPARDIASVFGAEIFYHEQDRTVELNGDGKKIIISSSGISPSFHVYVSNAPKTAGTICYEKDGDTCFDESVTYIHINDRAYIRLRSVLELFDFQVDYDHEKKTIAIKGKKLDAEEEVPLFDQHQQKIIQAFAGLDAATSVVYQGDWDNAAWPIKAVQKTILYPDRKEISYDVKRLEDGAQFQAILTQNYLQEEGRFYPIWNDRVLRQLFQINAMDGSRDWINLIGGTGGAVSYFEIGNLELLQLGKYQPLTYEIVSDNSETTEYRITKIRDVEKDIRFQMDKESGKILSYIATENESIKKLRLFY